MTKNGSDKGHAHNHTAVYSALFERSYHQPLMIFKVLPFNDS
jgi:hypothetical protein